MPRVAVVQGSLTDGSETLLVNASNTEARLGSGVSAAIRQACGPGYQAHIQAELAARYGGSMEPGEVLLTDAGAHPRAKWVAHVAVMDYRDGRFGFPTLDDVRRGCENLWREIDALPEPVTVAMVALGAGTGQLGVREPTRIACETLKERPTPRVEGITFYGFLLHEHLAMTDVVTSFFPDAVVGAETRAQLEALRGSP
jgi:O-acetyl-ADP-ribose deacetylase (regulator of RNase III)